MLVNLRPVMIVRPLVSGFNYRGDSSFRKQTRIAAATDKFPLTRLTNHLHASNRTDPQMI